MKSKHIKPDPFRRHFQDGAATMLLETNNGGQIGVIVKQPKGYRFLPSMDSHKPSRKFHEVPVDCVPRWAVEMWNHQYKCDRCGMISKDSHWRAEFDYVYCDKCDSVKTIENAGPELLEACEDALAIIKRDTAKSKLIGTRWAAREKLQNAIAKAKGES